MTDAKIARDKNQNQKPKPNQNNDEEEEEKNAFLVPPCKMLDARDMDGF